MQLLYWPQCLEYLEGGDGIMQDCPCEWKQTREENETMRKSPELTGGRHATSSTAIN